jgi:hypothetical protein
MALIKYAITFFPNIGPKINFKVNVVHCKAVFWKKICYLILKILNLYKIVKFWVKNWCLLCCSNIACWSKYTTTVSSQPTNFIFSQYIRSFMLLIISQKIKHMTVLLKTNREDSWFSRKNSWKQIYPKHLTHIN